MNNTRPIEGSRLRMLAVLCLLAAVAVLIWRFDGEETPAVATESARTKAATTPPTAEVATPANAERLLVAEPEPEFATTQPLPSATASEPADLEVRDWLSLRVVDGFQVPIRDAKVSIIGLRKQGDEGSWYAMRGDASVTRTDAEGLARIDYTRWVDIDGKAVMVDLTITHPEHISFRDSSFVVQPEQHTVQLQQGATVRLTAWFRTRSLVVKDIKIAMESSAQLGNDSWRREPDGSCTTRRLSRGPHFVTITHQSPELGSLGSRFVLFELGEQQLLDVDVELHALVTMRGHIDEAVPRPIVDGHVMVNLHARDEGISDSSNHEGVVAPDGSFEIHGLRPASGRIIARCEAWISQLVLGEGWRWSVPQAVSVPSAEDVVIRMERGGTLEVVATDENGTALPGVGIETSPNVSWPGVYSTIFPWGEWSATTDAKGVARISNLPTDPDLFVGATSTTHRLRKVDRDTTPTARIESGTTARCVLVLEAIPK